MTSIPGPDTGMQSNSSYCIRTLLLTFLGLPIVFQCLVLPVAFIGARLVSSAGGIYIYALLSLCAVLTGSLGYWHARRRQLPQSFITRFLPVIAPLLLTWLVWLVTVQFKGGDLSLMRQSAANIVFLPFFALLFFMAFGGEPLSTLLGLATLLYLSFSLFFIWGSRFTPVASYRGRTPTLIVLLLMACIMLWQAMHDQSALLSRNFMGLVLREEADVGNYRPFGQGNKLVVVEPLPNLRFESDDAPRIDGATAAYPVYAAAAQAMYSKQQADQKIKVSKTPDAYLRLIEGKTDVIFVAQASKEHQELAASKGIQLKSVPIAKEAFVFLVNPANPVRNLTQTQLRAIYTGRVDRWSDLGGENKPITAFQRPASSGSQTIMLAKVMQGEQMRKPLEEERAQNMGGLVRQVAAYRNTVEAIGYSFRYYTTRMKNEETVRMLAVDGVEPSIENIRNGTYPFTVDVFMVTAGEPKPSTRKLMDWMLSPIGQKLIQDTGYVARP
jgi:phosphate transport system substrate-binding protein